MVVPNILNGTAFLADGLWDNLHLRFGLEPWGIHKTFKGCGERLIVEHDSQFWKRGAYYILPQ